MDAAKNSDLAGSTEPSAISLAPVQAETSLTNRPTPTETRPLRVLMVEDNPSDAELELHALKRGGFEVQRDVVQTADDFAALVRHDTYDIVLADYRLPGWNGMATVEMLQREGLDVPVVVVSGALGDLKAVECIKQGAADYVLKDHLARLPEAVRRAIRECHLRAEHRRTLEELARSNRDLEQFAYVASHDLQEPLRMVATYTQLLAEHYQGKLDQEADKYIHYAVDGALRMQSLVSDLLAFSRVGRQRELQQIDCNLIIQSVTANLESAIRESEAQIVCAPLPTVVAARCELLQLFQNLVGNAIKFRRSAAPLIRIDAENTGRDWRFTVADNGIGISPEHTQDVFVIFKRLHTQAEYPGSGIGLSICKKIVEQNGGRIWVESEPGQGSTFKFTLPINRTEDLRSHR